MNQLPTKTQAGPREREREREFTPWNSQSDIFHRRRKSELSSDLNSRHSHIRNIRIDSRICIAPFADSYQTYFTFQNLLKAYYACRKRKRQTANAARVELNFEKELLKLEEELQNRTYAPGKSICFVVTYPTPREIFAADFRDRIVHHLLVGYLEPIFEKKFIHHSFACRKEKGAHLAIKHLKKSMRETTSGFSRPAFYLKIDIAAFFMSLKKDVLYGLIEKQIKNPEILWLTEKIIFHDPTKNYYRKGDPNLAKLIPDHKSLFHIPKDQGLPIGNLTSQFFANIYLDAIDQFAKHTLKIKHYFRYVDDMLLFHKDSEQLKVWHSEIDAFLKKNLRLHLHPDKSIFGRIDQGIDFVGFLVKPHCVFVRKRTVGNLKKKLRHWNCAPIPKDSETFQKKLNQMLSSVNSYYGQFKHADTFRLRKSIYQKHFKILKSYLEPVDVNFTHFRIKNFLEEPGKACD